MITGRQGGLTELIPPAPGKNAIPCYASIPASCLSIWTCASGGSKATSDSVDEAVPFRAVMAHPA